MTKPNECVLRNGKPMTEAQRRFAEERMEAIRRILHGEPPKVMGEVVQLAEYKERREAQINAQRAAAGMPSLKAARQMRESLEFAQPEAGKVLSGYNPITLFQSEIENEIKKER